MFFSRQAARPLYSCRIHADRRTDAAAVVVDSVVALSLFAFVRSFLPHDVCDIAVACLMKRWHRWLWLRPTTTKLSCRPFVGNPPLETATSIAAGSRARPTTRTLWPRSSSTTATAITLNLRVVYCTVSTHDVPYRKPTRYPSVLFNIL